MSQNDTEENTWECVVCEREFTLLWVPDGGGSGEFEPLPSLVQDDGEVCEECWVAFPEVFKTDFELGEINLDEILSAWRMWVAEKG